jgi:hypothetical protein
LSSASTTWAEGIVVHGKASLFAGKSEVQLLVDGVRKAGRGALLEAREKLKAKLDGEGLVKHEKYRGTVLTDDGRRIARAIVERHETLTRFLRLFALEEETIYRDVEGMEHHVSRPTLEVIRAVADALESDAGFLAEVKRRIDLAGKR